MFKPSYGSIILPEVLYLFSRVHPEVHKHEYYISYTYISTALLITARGGWRGSSRPPPPPLSSTPIARARPKREDFHLQLGLPWVAAQTFRSLSLKKAAKNVAGSDGIAVLERRPRTNGGTTPPQTSHITLFNRAAFFLHVLLDLSVGGCQRVF